MRIGFPRHKLVMSPLSERVSNLPHPTLTKRAEIFQSRGNVSHAAGVWCSRDDISRHLLKGDRYTQLGQTICIAYAINNHEMTIKPNTRFSRESAGLPKTSRGDRRISQTTAPCPRIFNLPYEFHDSVASRTKGPLPNCHFSCPPQRIGVVPTAAASTRIIDEPKEHGRVTKGIKHEK